MRPLRKAFGLTSLALILVVVAEGTASAGPFRLRVEDASTGLGVVLTDNGGGDLNPVIGALTFSGAIGSNFTVNVTTGVSKPLIGGVADIGQIDLNSVNVATTGAGMLILTLEDTGYIGPLDLITGSATVGGTLTAPSGSSLLVQSWVNGDDQVPALGPDQPVGPIGAVGGIPAGSVALWTGGGFSAGTGAFSSFTSMTFSNGAVATFAMFSRVVVTFTGPGSVAFDTNVQALPVPEPTSLLLLSGGLTGLGLLRRRKRPNR
jgi:hypothetical protein